MRYIPATATDNPRACSIVWIAQRPPEPQTRVQIPAGPLFLVAPKTRKKEVYPDLRQRAAAGRASTAHLLSRFLLRAFENATCNFVLHHIKRNVTKGEQSNFDHVAGFGINDEREVCTYPRSIGVDVAPIVLS
jgi:hypothetical protein